MYGQLQITTDQTTASTSFIQVPGMSLGFSVEEDQMWCEVQFLGVVSNATATDRCDLDIKVDGSFISATAANPTGNPAGLVGMCSATGGAQMAVNVTKKIFLTEGDHVIQLWFKTGIGGTAKVEATTWPALLSVTRLTNNSTLGHSQGAKFILEQ
jgi:hypothetical protein